MSHHGHSHTLDVRRAGNRRRMWIALSINLVLLVAQVVGGVVTGSLALLADAGHLASDVGAIAIGLFAAGMAARPGTARRTFGYQRGEVLAALVNGVALVVIAIVIVYAAIDRLGSEPEIDGGGVLFLGVAGLAGNLAAAWVLYRGERSDINLEGVLRHSVADALGSVGVIVAGAVIVVGGPAEADAVVSILIAALVAVSSWRLISEPFDVLMEAAPAGLEMEQVEELFSAVPEVRSVHELHVWTVTAGFSALAAHVVIAAGADRDLARRRLEAALAERFAIEHTTLQMEEEVVEALIALEAPEGGRTGK